MNKATKKITASITALTLLSLPNASFATEAKSVQNQDSAAPEELVQPVYGRDVAEVFAVTCSEASFSRFAEWARKTKFLTLQIDDQVFEVEAGENTAKIATPEYQYTIQADGRMALTVNGGTTKGDDGCDVFMNYIAKQEFKKSFANKVLELAIPQAFALSEKGNAAVEAMKNAKLAAGGGMSNTAKAALAVGAGGAVGAAIGAASPFYIVAAPVLGPIVIGAAAALGAAKLLGFLDKTKKRFNNFIRNGFAVQSCSDEYAVLTSDKRRVEVTKTPPPARLAMYDAETNKRIASDKKAKKKAKKAYENITKLADECDSQADAKEINAKLNNISQAAIARVDNIMTSGGGTSAPAAPAVRQAAPASSTQQQGPAVSVPSGASGTNK